MLLLLHDTQQIIWFELKKCSNIIGFRLIVNPSLVKATLKSDLLPGYEIRNYVFSEATSLFPIHTALAVVECLDIWKWDKKMTIKNDIKTNNNIFFNPKTNV